MVNPWAGEVDLKINGQRQVLRLTLGALAELEAELGATSLVELVERYEAGRPSIRDISALLLAGLRGGGWDGDASDLAKADIAGGPIAAAKVAGELLLRAFSLPESGTQ